MSANHASYRGLEAEKNWFLHFLSSFLVQSCEEIARVQELPSNLAIVPQAFNSLCPQYWSHGHRIYSYGWPCNGVTFLSRKTATLFQQVNNFAELNKTWTLNYQFQSQCSTNWAAKAQKHEIVSV